jgi:hypothetical protein
VRNQTSHLPPFNHSKFGLDQSKEAVSNLNMTRLHQNICQVCESYGIATASKYICLLTFYIIVIRIGNDMVARRKVLSLLGINNQIPVTPRQCLLFVTSTLKTDYRISMKKGVLGDIHSGQAQQCSAHVQ